MLDQEATAKITLYAALWGTLLTVSLLKLSRARSPTAGLPFAFLLSYGIAHSGALVHLVGGYSHLDSAYLFSLGYTKSTVADGFEASFLGMVGANIGFYIGGMWGKSPVTGSDQSGRFFVRLKYCVVVSLWLGAICMALETLLISFGLIISGMQAVLSTGRNLFAVGACTALIYLYIGGHRLQALLLLGLSIVVLPVLFLLTTAILADSVAVSLAIFCFFLTMHRGFGRSWVRNVFLTCLAILVGFVFSVVYLQTRSAIREVVWGGGSMSQAFSVMVGSAREFDADLISDTSSFELIDGRLNQNIFVGLAIEKLRMFPDTYEYGNTIALSFLGLVPRAVWPGKPERGGSQFIAKHTGRRFSEGTTFGAGPVFEFYVNYGYLGVFFGFVAIGGLLRACDIAAGRAYCCGDLKRITQFHLAGIAMLAPLADLFFIVTAVAASLVVGAALPLVFPGFRLGRGHRGHRFAGNERAPRF